MMPLCTTATPPEVWGWALASLGLPWVAQRVWAMPEEPFRGGPVQRVLQRLDLAQPPQAPQLAAADQGQARGVVAAVLQAPQPFHQDRGHVVVRDHADDAAHLSL